MAARKRGRDEGWIEVSVGQCDGYGALSLPLTKAHCTAIGLVMMQWAYIEREINSEASAASDAATRPDSAGQCPLRVKS